MVTITDIIKEFAKYGFTETPLTIAEMEHVINQKWPMDLIYGLGCDLQNGWKMSEIYHLYQRDLEQLDAYA